MLGRLLFSSYSRLLAGISLAAVAIALTGCNDQVAQKPPESSTVLVASHPYRGPIPERSFVGTIKPGIETDMGFRATGKVAKRLVEVGQKVDLGQPLATLDEVDLKLQAEQAEAEQRAATGVLAQAGAAEQRARDLRAKGWATDAQLNTAKAAGDEAREQLNRAERSVELTNNSLSYATLVADTRGVVTATMIEPGQVVAAGQAAIRVARLGEKEAVVAVPETLLNRAKSGVATVTLWSEPDKKYIRDTINPTERIFPSRASDPRNRSSTIPGNRENLPPPPQQHLAPVARAANRDRSIASSRFGSSVRAREGSVRDGRSSDPRYLAPRRRAVAASTSSGPAKHISAKGM